MSVHHHSFPPADAGPAITLWQVRQALGRGDLSDNAFIAYVQSLVDQCGFPPPFPSPVKGKGLVASVTRRSTFRRDAVEAWRGDYLPPAGGAALDAAAAAAAAHAMDQAALGLGALRLINGGRA